MRAHVVTNGVITNTIEVPSMDFLPNLIEPQGEEGIGWAYVNGAFVEPAPVVVVPEVVSMRQARLALLGAGLLDNIETAMVSMPRAAQIEWEYASAVYRDSSLVAGMGSMLNMTSDQLDQLFIIAETL